MLTIKTFSATNRSKKIGNSLYKICRKNNTEKWYIYEIYSNMDTWIGYQAHYNSSLEDTINTFNSITDEKEIIRLRFN